MVKLRFVTLLLLAVTLAACAPATPAAAPAPNQANQPAKSGSTAVPAAAKPVSGGTVTRALTSDPTSLDPHGPAGSGQNVILPYLYDTLVYRAADNSYKPYLAQSWQVAPDGKTVTFKLRDGIKFHDGTSLDAAAVKASFERFKEKGGKSPVAPGILDISKIEAVDTATVRFYFDQPSTIFFSTISMPYAGIISPTAAKTEGDAFGQKPVGSGPYKFSQWQPGVAVTLVRNPDFKWAPEGTANQVAPYVDKLVFKTIPDAGTQLTALQSGDVDLIYVNNPAQIAKLRADKNVTVNDTVMNSLVYLGFNCKKAPFDDVKVRRALSLAVNKDDILKTALSGSGQVAFAPLATTLPGFDASLKQYELSYDPAKAKDLLKAAGFAQGSDGAWSKGNTKLGVTLVTSTRAPNDAIATMVQSELKAIGVAVEIKQLEATAATDALTKGQFDLMLWRYDWNDADVLYTYLASSRIGRTNRNFYSNSQVDDLLGQALHQPDDKARLQLYLAAQKQIMADAPWQPLYTPVDVIAVRNRVQGVVIGSMGRTIMNSAFVTDGK
ncbi:MAG TPA: ABC transporter substrate-binding protein [Anaerolineae bacterium]